MTFIKKVTQYILKYSTFFAHWSNFFPLRYLRPIFRHIYQWLKTHIEKAPNFSDDALSILIMNKEGRTDERLLPVDIIIPVYVKDKRGGQCLKKLLDSLYGSIKDFDKLIIIDDASPINSITTTISSFAANMPQCIFFRQEINRGFVSTVNTALKNTTRDVIILNMDTVVPEKFIDRLIHPLQKNRHIASATPFTNSGTIASFPIIDMDNKLAYGLNCQDVDDVFREASNLGVYEIPTGVGFCMAMNRETIDKIGFFDEDAFGRGYGEEVDWCQRAKNNGYTNVLVPDLFVYHNHGISFPTDEKKNLCEKHNQIIVSRYPKYDFEIRAFCEKDNLLPLRLIHLINLAQKKSGIKTQLFFTHDMGGGADQYALLHVAKYKSIKPICLVRYIQCFQCFKLKFTYEDVSLTIYFKSFKNLILFLSRISIGEVFINELVGYKNTEEVLEYILYLKKKFYCELVVPIHDFNPICMRYTLLNKSNHFCFSCKSPEDCLICSAKHHYISMGKIIKRWRNVWREILLLADRIIAFSCSSKEILLKVYPEIVANKIDIIPHSVQSNQLRKVDITNNTQLHVGVIGAINIPKGLNIVYDLLDTMEKHNEGKITIIGVVEKQKKLFKSNRLCITGRYNPEDLPEIIEQQQINVCLFPSIWPETYAYVVDEIMAMGMPILIFNIGAPPERVGNYPKGYVLPIDSSAEDIYQTLQGVVFSKEL